MAGRIRLSDPRLQHAERDRPLCDVLRAVRFLFSIDAQVAEDTGGGPGHPQLDLCCCEYYVSRLGTSGHPESPSSLPLPEYYAPENKDCKTVLPFPAFFPRVSRTVRKPPNP